MNPKLMRKLIISLTSFLILIMIGIVATYAYFQISEDHSVIIESGEFVVTMDVYFSGSLVTLNSPFYDHDKGVVIVNAFDPNASNYIGNLDVYIELVPKVTARYRFKVNQEWEVGTYYVDQNEENPIPPVIQSLYHERTSFPYYPFSSLKFSADFNQTILTQDGYIYYDGLVEHSETPVIYHIIDGGDGYPTRSNEVLYEECYLYFDITFDIIQANRMEELWGIDETFFS